MFKIFWYHLKTALNFCIKGDKVKANERCGTIRTEDGPSQNWLSRISHYRNHNFLFIYSEADELIPAEKVENFADILIKRQNHVKYLKFKDSPHVKHYLMHPNVSPILISWLDTLFSCLLSLIWFLTLICRNMWTLLYVLYVEL